MNLLSLFAFFQMLLLTEIAAKPLPHSISPLLEIDGPEAAHPCKRPTCQPLVLMFAIDGLRADFVTPTLTPELHKLSTEGASAVDGIRVQFPTVPLPNFVAAASGLTPEHSGIIGNYFFKDASLSDFFDYFSDRQNALKPIWWDKIDPLWIINQNAGCSSGAIGYPSADAPYPGGTIDHYQETPYNSTRDQLKAQIEQVISWFKDPVEPKNLVLFHSREPDNTQHLTDIFSEPARKAIKQVDNLVKYLMQRVEEEGLKDCLNIVFFADHGFTNIHKASGLIDLASQIGLPFVDYFFSGFSLFSGRKSNEELFSLAKTSEHLEPKFSVYKKKDVPKSLRYQESERIGGIVGVEKLGYQFFFGQKLPDVEVYGEHQSKPDYDEMRSFFLATGPVFKKGYKLLRSHRVENLDIFPLVASILNVTPAENDGKLSRIGSILKYI